MINWSFIISFIIGIAIYDFGKMIVETAVLVYLRRRQPVQEPAITYIFKGEEDLPRTPTIKPNIH